MKFEAAAFVLHCFQKKSKRGIATPKRNIDIIRASLKSAEAPAKELRNEKRLIDGIEVQRSSGNNRGTSGNVRQ